jgi:hypothetical protein
MLVINPSVIMLGPRVVVDGSFGRSTFGAIALKSKRWECVRKDTSEASEPKGKGGEKESSEGSKAQERTVKVTGQEGYIAPGRPPS